MKNGLIAVAVMMFVGGLVALYLGITSMDAAPCFIGDCKPVPDNIVFFPVGLGAVILGSILWTAAAGNLTGGDTPTRNPLARVGYFGIFGLTFLGVGAVMFIADRQPDVDHTTNVLTILGVIFGFVGICAVVADILSSRSLASDEHVLATGIRGRATVT